MPAMEIFRSRGIEPAFFLDVSEANVDGAWHPVDGSIPKRSNDGRQQHAISTVDRSRLHPTSGWEYALGFEPGELGSLVGMFCFRLPKEVPVRAMCLPATVISIDARSACEL
jgi:hypothetical protein